MAGFKHFSLIAGGDTMEDHSVPNGEVGPSVMSMKVWAASVEQAVDVICEIGNEIGFKIEQNVEVVRSKATQAPRDEPFAYEVRVTPCTEDDRAEAVARQAELLSNE
ncbi:hypothetical protein [Henriciella litoralis]|uniref:hypothetical protein n=1 Tax=Henriciella litoralis TaxID=568102 RepID=UPI0009FFB1BA|nr:hypothetical protein [Henriciella litoralis]